MANRYWVGGSGTWDASATTHWSTASGGAAGASAPTGADVAIFDGSSGGGTATTASGATASGVTQNTGSTVTLQLGADLTLSATHSLFAGTLALGSYTLTAATFSASVATARTLNFETGKIALTGSGATVWNVGNHTSFTVSGTPRVDLTYSGSVGTRTIGNGSSGGTESTAISFYITAGTDTVAVTNTSKILDMNFTGFSGTFGNNTPSLFGSLVLVSGMTLTAGANSMTFASTNASTRTITTAGKTLDFPVSFNGVGGSWSFADAFTMGATRTLTLTNGTLDAAGNSVSIGFFGLGSGTKTLTLGSGTWSVSGAGTGWSANTNVSGLTVSASTGTISMTSASAKTFAGGAKTWPTLNQGGAGALTIQQSNAFTNITNTVQPATITLTAGTTQTVGSFGVSGTAGNLITLDSSSAGSQATLSDSSGTNSVSYVSIKDCAATGGATWEAFITNGNIDSGNNTGWDFFSQLGRYMYNVRKSKRILQ